MQFRINANNANPENEQEREDKVEQILNDMHLLVEEIINSGNIDFMYIAQVKIINIPLVTEYALTKVSDISNMADFFNAVFLSIPNKEKIEKEEEKNGKSSVSKQEENTQDNNNE